MDSQKQNPHKAGSGFSAAAFGDGLHRDDSPASTARRAVTIAAPDLSNARRWCPFGREVEAAPGNVFVYAGRHAWERAKRRRDAMGPGHALLLPPNEAPESCRWPPMPAGCVLDGRDIQRPEAIALAACIVAAGSPLVYVLRDSEAFAVTSPGYSAPREVTA